MTKYSVAAGIALALVAGSALAADLPSRKGPPPAYVPPPPAFSWTGLYGGVNIGYGFDAGGNPEAGSFAYLAPAVPGFAGTWSNPHNLNGVTGGGQVGYNYQFSPWLVLGVETDIQAADINTQQNFAGFGSNPLGPATNHVPVINSAQSVDWWGTVRGRIGLVMPSYPNLMVYGTGGFAYGQVNHTVSVNDLFPALGASQIGRGTYFNTNTGWTVGGGAEWSPMSFPAWSLKVEYLYTNLGPTYVALPGALNAGAFLGANFIGAHVSPTQFHTVRAGLNWHFNPFAASAPVLAKY
ncbi:outer membrane protein [Methylocystis sp. JAN1]|uniref:outer membrane protein n=1 Tax=Methylocystis sp. JAN1 TaxID=3397211 RepID=UPI003FA2FF18